MPITTRLCDTKIRSQLVCGLALLLSGWMTLPAVGQNVRRDPQTVQLADPFAVDDLSLAANRHEGLFPLANQAPRVDQRSRMNRATDPLHSDPPAAAQPAAPLASDTRFAPVVAGPDTMPAPPTRNSPRSATGAPPSARYPTLAPIYPHDIPGGAPHGTVDRSVAPQYVTGDDLSGSAMSLQNGGDRPPYVPSYLRSRLDNGFPSNVGPPPVTSVPAGERYGGPDLSALSPSRLADGVSASSMIRVEEPERGDVSPELEAIHERVLDLYDGESRDLISRVREELAASQPVDVTAEDWVTVRGSGKRITWGGRIDTDWVSWLNDDQFGGQPNYLEFRRLRLFAAGEGYGIYEYQLELEFAPEFERSRLDPGEIDNFGIEVKDAFIAMQDMPLLGYVVLGHFRTPIGLDERTSTRYIPFLERSLPTRLLPGRELGIAAFTQSISRDKTLSYGVFFDDLEESSRSIIDDNQGFRFVGRGTWTPYYDQLSGGRCLFHTGLGYAYNRPRHRDEPFVSEYRPVQFRARPETHAGDWLIDTDDLNVDSYHLLNGELAWVNGPLTIQSEGVWAELDEIDRGWGRSIYGVYIQTSYFLTGESRPYDRDFGVFRRLVPYENFWMVPTYRGPQAGWGAWEVAFRWSHLSFDEINGQELHDLTLGLNWYWSPHTRIMANWIHTMARQSPQSLLADAEGDILSFRVQLDF